MALNATRYGGASRLGQLAKVRSRSVVLSFGAMSALSILVRLLLSVALILNGSVGAMVAAHAMTDHARHVGAGGVVSGQDENTGQAFAEPSCHRIQGVAALAAPSSDTTAAAVGDGPRHPSDCCGSADCRSGCAQHCAAAITGTAMVQSAVIPRVAPMLPLPASHVSPALPHLIRPPIG